MSGKKKSYAKKRANAPRMNEAQREQARLARKHADYKNRWLGIGFGIGGAALLCFALYGFVTADAVRSGDLHKSIPAQSDHCQVTSAMLSYYLREHADSYLAYAAETPGAAAFDPEKPLRAQMYNEAEGTTWYEFLMETTMNTVQETLRNCEAAYRAGYELPEDVQQQIAKDAAETDLTKYQAGVTEEDVASVMTLQMTSRLYMEEAKSEIAVTEEEVQAEAKADPKTYELFSMLIYSFSWDENDAAGEQAARKHAEELAACKTPEAFTDYVRQYMEQEEQLPAETAAQRLNGMHMTAGYSSYNEDTQKWLETAKPYDTFTLDGSQARYMEVIMLETEPALDTSDCVDLRIIYLTESTQGSMDAAKTLAANIQQACKDSGGTPESFAKLAQQYSESSTTAANGGLVEGYSRIRTTYGTETTEWAFSADRKQGDMFLCERETAVIIAYYEGKNDRCGWENQIYAALLRQKNDALLSGVSSLSVVKDLKAVELADI